jgi:hypothetical protein
MAWGTERDQPVEVEVRAPLGAFDDMVDLEGAPTTYKFFVNPLSPAFAL